MAIRNATDETFAQETSSGLVIADLGAPWCGPCKMIAPVLEEIDEEQGDQMNIVKVDIDENMETAQKYGVMSVPTLLFFKDGELVDQAVGFKPKEEIVSIAEKHA
ncbi:MULTISPECIES: thioredoxin [Halobacillus]|uniref:thioredoxin n=1 Tax=Halobacillus TaxID=45667 RepID=UPI00136B9E71|nr:MULTISPECIES: thioredoxin [Halobacillus]MCA1023737.1 thioredoxin [Halobacillus litoralis]MYL31538.1 thioredoxin [Halobacillus halophilus]MYL39156.1 thioredoxin [Halobacillus litoralis]